MKPIRQATKQVDAESLDVSEAVYGAFSGKNRDVVVHMAVRGPVDMAVREPVDMAVREPVDDAVDDAIGVAVPSGWDVYDAVSQKVTK